MGHKARPLLAEGLERRDLVGERLERTDGRSVCVDNHIDLETLVLALEELLLEKVLAHVLWRWGWGGW